MIVVLVLLGCSRFELPGFDIEFVEPVDPIDSCERLCISPLSTMEAFTDVACAEGCAAAETECPDVLEEIMDCFQAVEMGIESVGSCDSLVWAMDDDWVEGEPTCGTVSLLDESTETTP